MPIHGVDATAGTFHHVCRACGHQRPALSLDPADGDLTVRPECLVTSPCPACLAARGVLVYDCLLRDLPAWEAGEGSHPGSLAGTTTDLSPTTRSIVTEHTVGYHLNPARVAEVRHIRAMQQHPKLAPHAPLRQP